MGPFVFHHNYAISCDGGECPFRGNRFFKMMIFETKYHKNLHFLDLLIFRVSSLFTPPWCFGHFLAPKSIVFQVISKWHDPNRTEPTRTEPNRTDPNRTDPLAFPQEIRQFCYRIIKIRTRPDPTRPPNPRTPDPTNVLREERKGPIIPRFSGGGYLNSNSSSKQKILSAPKDGGKYYGAFCFPSQLRYFVWWGRKSLPGESILKNDDFWDKTL